MKLYWKRLIWKTNYFVLDYSIFFFRGRLVKELLLQQALAVASDRYTEAAHADARIELRADGAALLPATCDWLPETLGEA